MLYLLWRHGQQKLFALGIALILGGAIGNIIDRILRGQVVDFVLLFWKDFYWPAFNIADSAICIGAVLMVWDQLASKPANAAGDSTTGPTTHGGRT
jgi:signal peptidase II